MKIPVAVLGATGAVGQRMVQLLHDHPWFEIVQLCASEKSAGRRYEDVVQWLLPTAIPENIRALSVTLPTVASQVKIAFSALDSTVARSIENEWAEQGIAVVTNASPHRMDSSVPLIVPEVNPDHLELVREQTFQKGGMIVANPNCATIGVTLSLKPLVDCFGIEKVLVTTFQATSGAGFPGVASLSILDNVLPYISGEEEKVESEPLKIFSQYTNGSLIAPELRISASCTRVPVLEGHLKSVSVQLREQVSIEEVTASFENFVSPLEGLPSAPKKPIYFYPEMDAPQSRLHRNLENGMAIGVGSLRPCPVLSYKFFTLSHNTIRGGAGGSLLLGELLVLHKFI